MCVFFLKTGNKIRWDFNVEEFMFTRDLFLNRKVNVVVKTAEDFQEKALFSFGNRGV